MSSAGRERGDKGGEVMSFSKRLSFSNDDLEITIEDVREVFEKSPVSEDDCFSARRARAA